MNSNLALITTLYNTKGADLYKEIYFPLIRYSVMCIYNEYEDKQRYYDVTALQEKIQDKSGLLIPLQALKASICAMARSKDNGVQAYKKGAYFKILSNISEGLDNVDAIVESTSGQFRRLELFFKEFLEAEGLTSTKTIKDFFLDNSSDVLRYIDSNDALSVVNQEYVNVVRFIDWVKGSNPEYYTVVENFLWGAIVAGFLQRKNTDLGIKTVDKVDYYLDSSLLLSLLGLNSEENVAYANDLVRIITDTGGCVVAHAITLREIKRILEQVELSQGPRRGSSIEQAWIHRDMTLSDILHIRNGLLTLLMNLNVKVVRMSDGELDDIELKYKNSYDVKLLAKQRESRNEDLIREIHDIYMRDYVRTQNKEGSVIEKQAAYFVSLNSELVKFSNNNSGRAISVIHAAKIVMNLWLHNAASAHIKQVALAEVMSRCYALNQTDVRIKLKVFFKYYRDCSLTQEDIEGMYSSLIHRSADTISAYEKLLENEESVQENKTEISTEIINGLKVAVAKEKAEREAMNEATQQRVKELSDRTAALEQVIKEGENELGNKNAVIEQYKESHVLDSRLMERLQKELQTERELRKIVTDLHDLGNQRYDLNSQRDKSVCYFKFWFILIGESLACLLLALCAIMAIATWDKDQIINIFTIGFAISFLALVTRLNNMYLFSPRVSKMKLRDEQYRLWEDKHPEYALLDAQIERNEKRKIELEMAD